MSASPVSSRTQQTRRRVPQRKHEELVILLIDVEGLPRTHALSAAMTLSAIRGASEFEARQLVTAQDMITSHRMAYYMIQAGAVICRIIFRADGSTAHIDAADCYTAYPHIHPRSYSLFYVMAQLLEKIGFVDVRLTANEQEGRFFQTLGFRRSRRRTEEMRATPVDIANAAASVFT